MADGQAGVMTDHLQPVSMEQKLAGEIIWRVSRRPLALPSAQEAVVLGGNLRDVESRPDQFGIPGRLRRPRGKHPHVGVQVKAVQQSGGVDCGRRDPHAVLQQAEAVPDQP
jgi:hypothetical protein